MNRLIALVILIVIIIGCSFDEKRQFDLQYPATLEITNDSQQKISVKSIYSTSSTKGGFVLEGGSIGPKSKLSLRISESVYDAIRVGSFVLEGVCGEVRNWRIDGTSLPRNATEDQDQWKIMISIPDCEG